MTDLFDLPFEEEEPEPATPKREPREGGSSQFPAPSTQPPAPTRRVYSVTELTVRVRDLLEEQFAEVWVEGELSGCRVWNTGHLYLTL
jgi:exodeoxyribonuclease VII large subunit